VKFRGLCFDLVNVGDFLIFFLSFWGFSFFFLVKFCLEAGWGLWISFCELWRFFFKKIIISSLFFLSFWGPLILFVCVKGVGVSSCELWGFSVLVFWNLKVFKFSFFSFAGFQLFVCEEVSQVGGGEGYLPFLLWTLKVSYYGILKFWNFQFSSYHFVGFYLFVWSFC